MEQIRPATDPAPALSRGIALIEWLGREGQSPLELIARRTGWPKSSTLRYLQALAAAGVVRQDPDSLTWVLLKALRPLPIGPASPLEQARTRLAPLAAETGHCAELYQLTAEGHIELIDRADPADHEHLLVARIGFRRDPAELDTTTLLRLAFDPAAKPVRKLWRCEAGAQHAVAAAMRDAAIRAVRTQGYAADHDFNLNGIRRFGVPLLDAQDRLLGVLAVAQRQTPRASVESSRILNALLPSP